MTRPAVALELYDLDAAAELLDALRGRRPRSEQAARRRADALSPALLTALAHFDKDPADADTP